MKNYNNIAEIQTGIITKNLIDLANKADVELNVEFLSRVLREDRVSNKLGFPTFSRPSIENDRADRKLEHNQKLNIDGFNANIRDIASDIETIDKSIGMFDRKIDNLARSIDRLAPLVDAAKNRVDDAYRELRRQMGIVNFSYRDTVSDITKYDLALTSAFINVERGIIRSDRANSLGGSSIIGQLDSSRMSAISPDVNGQLAVDSQFYKLFVPGARNNTALTMIKTVREEASAVITADLQDIPITANSIVIDALNTVPTRITIEVESGGEVFEVVKDEFIVDGIYTFDFDVYSVDKLNMYMWQTVETYKNEDNNFVYKFKLNNVALDYVVFSRNTEFVTQAVNTPNPITDVLLESSDYRPPGTDIRYFVSKDKTRWIPITPRNLSPDSPNSVVNLSLSSIESIETVDNDSASWTNLSPVYEFGPTPLYNILEGTTNQYIDPAEEKLLIDADTENEIIEDSIKVYRGYDDWSIVRQNFETEEEYSNVELRFQPYDKPKDSNGFITTPSAEQYNYDSITARPILRFDNVGLKITLGAGQKKFIKTKYPIANNNLEVVDPRLNRSLRLSTVDEIDYASGIIYLDSTDAVVGSEVLITYHVYIEDVENTDNVTIEIQPSSVAYRDTPDDNADLITNNELYYSTTDRLFHLRAINTLVQNEEGWATTYLSFTISKTSQNVYKLYKTYVYYDVETELEIFPFTQEEYSVGNRHIINGNDVSLLKSYTVPSGTHEFISSQPYKSDPNESRDTNPLTNKKSSAGIQLGNYTWRRGFEKSLRKVDVNILSRIIPPGDSRSFSYKDGKIYLNFRPDELPENTLLLTPHLTANDILGKEALYFEDGKNSFKEYAQKNEKILVEYKVRPLSTDEDKVIYLRGEMYPNIQKGTSPAVFGFELLFL